MDWGQRLYSTRAFDRVPKINLYGHVWTSGTVAIPLKELVNDRILYTKSVYVQIITHYGIRKIPRDAITAAKLTSILMQLQSLDEVAVSIHSD